MTASELAFLALGLVLGAASGAAGLVLLTNRAPRREIRVTVTRDALPRRSETLSQDAFVTRPGEPAPGGPADRRALDRAESGAQRIGIPIEPGAGGWFDPRPSPAPSVDAPAAVLDRTAVRVAAPNLVAPAGDPTETPLERMLRGDHRAMVEVVDRIAGEDGARRREWELLLGGLVEALADAAVEESVIDFPMGTAFWDTFTIEQCRRIVAALASMGFRYDGRSGWLDGRVPAYRDLAQALADIEVDPRRVRAWPTQAEIAGLFTGARPAPEELLAAAGPGYAAEDVRALLGERGPDLGRLWQAWDAVRPALLYVVEPASEASLSSGAAPVSSSSSITTQ